jgi:hypothetical protein
MYGLPQSNIERKGKPMFILRTLFWLGVVILLLPTGKSEDQADSAALSQAPALSTGQALTAAYSTVNDLSGFCGRNPEACAVGAAAFAAAEEKAKSGVRMIYRWATGAPAHQPPAEPDHRRARDAGLSLSGIAPSDGDVTGSIIVAAGDTNNGRNTLKIEDVLPDWSGPEVGKPA